MLAHAHLGSYCLNRLLMGVCSCWSFVASYTHVQYMQQLHCHAKQHENHCTCHLCFNKWYPLQFQVVFLHERRHELLTFPNRPLSHESCLVCRLIGRQCVHNIVLSECLADDQIQTMPGFSHFSKLSPCEMCMASVCRKHKAALQIRHAYSSTT